MRYIFIGGQHHGGTSLVSALLGDNQAGIASLRHTPSAENEGQHLQHMWPPYHARNHSGCAPFSISLCLPMFMKALSTSANATATIESDWAPWWQCDIEPCAWRVEKDPDVGSLFFKSVIYPNAILLAVMRHPFALAAFDGYRTITNRVEISARSALARWMSVWPFFMAHVCRLQQSHGIVRFEALADPSAPTTLLALSRYGHNRPRRLDIHGRYGNVTVDPHLIWEWVNSSRPLQADPLAAQCEYIFRALTGYSLQRPVEDSSHSLLICDRNCKSSNIISLAAQLERALGEMQLSSQMLWAAQNPGFGSTQSMDRSHDQEHGSAPSLIQPQPHGPLSHASMEEPCGAWPSVFIIGVQKAATTTTSHALNFFF